MNRTTWANLAIELVRADPRASDLELVRRWVVRVQDDDDLLNACLQQGGNRAIAMARDYIAREQRAAKRRERQKELAIMLAKAAADQQANLKRIVDKIGSVVRGNTTANSGERE